MEWKPGARQLNKLLVERLIAINLFLLTPSAVAEKQFLVDLIIKGDYIVTMNDDYQIIQNGAVAVNSGEIVSVGSALEVEGQYKAKETLPGEDRLVMPGLVNGHSHAAMTLLRGVADDLPLNEWLNDYIFPAERMFVDPEFVRLGTELACWEMVRGGTTTFVDMYSHPDTVARVVDGCGMRALVSATIIDQKSPDANDADESLRNAVEFVKKWQNLHPRITPIFGPHANYTLSADQLMATRDAAKRLGSPISIHMAESMFEVDLARDKYGTGSVSMFESIDFFDGPTIAAHMVWPSEQEIKILSRRKVGVIYNPTSNMKTAAGVAPIVTMLEDGIAIGIGTDGAASNNDLDMWEEMRIGALLQKVNRMDPKVMSAKTVLSMATDMGADAVGLGGIIGSLEPGKRADLIQVLMNDVHHIPTFDVVSHLVYVTDEQDVDVVIVDGSILMRDGRPLRLDRERIHRAADLLARNIQTELKEFLIERKEK